MYKNNECNGRMSFWYNFPVKSRPTFGSSFIKNQKIMNTEVMQDHELLFEEDVVLTGVKDYGVSWEQFAAGTAPIPPEGLKFDIHFEGAVTGDRVNGKINGVDYLTVRSDGRLFLDLHASIETADGATIKVKESGINAQGTLRLNMDFHTNDKRYKWLNHIHVWGAGSVDFATGKVKIQGYQH